MTKMTVVTDKKGKVVATYMPEENYGREGPIFRLEAGPGQKLHEIDMPVDVRRALSADNLHKRLNEFLKEERAKTKKETPKKKRK
jgi:hypothetical protein